MRKDEELPVAVIARRDHGSVCRIVGAFLGLSFRRLELGKEESIELFPLMMGMGKRRKVRLGDLLEEGGDN